MPGAQLFQLDLPTRRMTVRLGEALARTARGGELLVLSGDLGAGKTFLSRAIARGLGVAREIRVTSPTFTLVHQYAARLALVHADLYRIGQAHELVELGLDELRSQGALLLVEWGEPFVAELGGDALVLRLELASRGRIARLTATGPCSERWLAEVLTLHPVVRTGHKDE